MWLYRLHLERRAGLSSAEPRASPRVFSALFCSISNGRSIRIVVHADLDVQDQNMTAALYCELARLLVQNGTNTEFRIDTTKNGSIIRPSIIYPLLLEDGADPSPKMGLQRIY